jgi:transcriptional regulator with XRE-family HTH domain
MTFGEKLKAARLAQNLSQIELAAKVGITERSIYSYEQTGIYPRSGTLKRLAEALNVEVSFLIEDDDVPESVADNVHDLFLANAKKEYGYKGAREAKDVIARAQALFAGGELNDESKDLFFQSLMEVYLESKAESREKFTPRSRKSRKRPDA